MRICSRKGCNKIGEMKDSPTAFYCLRCFRFKKMRNAARTGRKYIPSFEELERLLIQCGLEIRCLNCNKKMIWHAKLGKLSDVISLQHNHDSSVIFICHACNVGHGHSKLGDDYFKIPKNHKHCLSCNQMLNQTRFYKNKNNSGNYMLSVCCKKCQSVNSKKSYRAKNEEKKRQ